MSVTIGTTWPIPAPGDISGRCASVYEQAFPPNPLLGVTGIDARNPNTVATTNCRITELAMMDLYFYQGQIAVELMPDTALANLPRFAAIYSVPRDQPSTAEGNVIVTGAPGDAVPSDIVFGVPGTNTTWTSTAGGEIGSGGTLSVPVEAYPAGTGGNLEAGTSLTIQSPVEGLTSQTGVVDSDGITGGLDLEQPANWRARILQRIRQPAMGGSVNDYQTWAKAALVGVSYVNVIAGYGGLPNVGVVIGMAGPAVPTSGQIATVQAYLDQPSIKPVTAVPVVLAIALNPIDITLHLAPDTPTLRTAATDALALSFQQNAVIDGTTTFASLDNAVSSVVSGGSFTLVSPSVDTPAPTPLSINVIGTVNFV
jgi:uncharacterized phage protein gp47/JayE